LIDEAHSLLDLCLPGEDKARPPEDPLQEIRQRTRHLAELGKHQRLLLPAGDLVGDLGEARELATLLRRVRTVAQPVPWAIADLFEAHERREHDAAPLDSARRLERRAKVLDGLLVERHLLLREAAKRAYLRLVRQIGDDAAVGLEASEDVGANELAERAVAA